MTPSTTQPTEPDTYNSNVLDGCLLFPVYSVVEIPRSKIHVLDDIILASRKGLHAIDSTSIGTEEEAASAALFFMNSGERGSVVTCGSHVPMKHFPEYPWAGKSLAEIFEYVKQVNEEAKAQDGTQTMSQKTFAIVDPRTLQDGTLLLCSYSTPPNDEAVQAGAAPGIEGDSKPVSRDLATLRADGFASLHCLVPDEMGTKPLRDYEELNSRRGGFVMTKEYLHQDHLDYVAGVQSKVARGEPLREAETRITGLENREDERDDD